MSTDPRKMDYVKSLHLKQVGIALASLWVIVLIAAVAATIYREIDGPTIRSTITQNLNLASVNSTLNNNLDSAEKSNNVANETIDQLNLDLRNSQSDLGDLKKQFASYFLSFPVIQLPPNPSAPVATSFP